MEPLLYSAFFIFILNFIIMCLVVVDYYMCTLEEEKLFLILILIRVLCIPLVPL